ncbi:MAG: hypothetical protein PXX83_08760 [Candidatus Nitrosotalea sp.]|nr:hypothetical protein [Candidatus Nitrosotalea sp.]
MLFGVFAIHSPDLCPMNNKNSKKIFMGIQGKMKATQKKFNVKKVLGFYMSVLEHEWIIILDAENAHDIEQMCIEVGISTTSTVKIVPISDMQKVMDTLKSS